MRNELEAIRRSMNALRDAPRPSDTPNFKLGVSLEELVPEMERMVRYKDECDKRLQLIEDTRTETSRQCERCALEPDFIASMLKAIDAEEVFAQGCAKFARTALSIAEGSVAYFASKELRRSGSVLH